MLFVHLQALGCRQLLVEELAAGQADGVVGWLGEMEGWEAIGGWLWLNVVALRVWLGVVGWLRVVEGRRILNNVVS